MEQIVTVIHVLTALALIGFILLQQGKGAEAGASFGAGASQTLFGSQGTGSIMTRITAILATTFFVTSLTLGYLAIHQNKPTSIEQLIDKAQQISDDKNPNLSDIPDTDSTSKNSRHSNKDKDEQGSKNVKNSTSNVDNNIPMPTPKNQLPDNLKSESVE